MTQVVQGGTTFSTQTYNAFGQRVETYYPGYNAKVDGLFDPTGKELGYYNEGSGSFWDRDIWVGTRMIAQAYPSDTYFLHANALGSDTQLSNHAGSVPMDLMYYPWGQVWQVGGSRGGWVGGGCFVVWGGCGPPPCDPETDPGCVPAPPEPPPEEGGGGGGVDTCEAIPPGPPYSSFPDPRVGDVCKTRGGEYKYFWFGMDCIGTRGPGSCCAGKQDQFWGYCHEQGRKQGTDVETVPYNTLQDTYIECCGKKPKH